MKITSLVCWFYERAWFFWADSLEPQPYWLHRHLSRCPHCRQTLERVRQIAVNLQRDASNHQQAVPPFLAAKIKSRLRHNPNPSGQTSHFRFPIWAMTAAACLVLLAGILVLNQTIQPPASNLASDVPLSDAVALLAVPVDQASGHSLLVWGEKLEQPLEQEMTMVVQDAQNAVLGLADNFLPKRICSAWSKNQSAHD
jgi:hypothetical protein